MNENSEMTFERSDIPTRKEALSAMADVIRRMYGSPTFFETFISKLNTSKPLVFTMLWPRRKGIALRLTVRWERESQSLSTERTSEGQSQS